MARRRRTITAVVVLAIIAFAVPVAALGVRDGAPLARNVILLIDDGAGYATHEVGSLYDTGLRKGEAYNLFPFQFAVSTYSYGSVEPGGCVELVGYDPARAWSEWAYVNNDPTDSAAAATAMATGVKTYDAGVGVDCQAPPKPVENIVETVEALGKATGIVSSVPVSHATPAAFVGHNGTRDADTALAAEMILSSRTDVIMGGGHRSSTGWATRPRPAALPGSTRTPGTA